MARQGHSAELAGAASERREGRWLGCAGSGRLSSGWVGWMKRARNGDAAAPWRLGAAGFQEREGMQRV